MGRIDIHVEVPRVAFEKLSDKRTGEPSATVRERVEAARTVQRERFSDTDLHINADIGPGEIRQFYPADKTGTHLLKSTRQQMQVGDRAYHHILKLAHTITDLADESDIQIPHIAEVIQYRPRQQV
jgi:magnesium chelatase family protein